MSWENGKKRGKMRRRDKISIYNINICYRNHHRSRDGEVIPYSMYVHEPFLVVLIIYQVN